MNFDIDPKKPESGRANFSAIEVIVLKAAFLHHLMAEVLSATPPSTDRLQMTKCARIFQGGNFTQDEADKTVFTLTAFRLNAQNINSMADVIGRYHREVYFSESGLAGSIEDELRAGARIVEGLSAMEPQKLSD